MAEPPERPPFPPSDGIQLAVAYLAVLPLLCAPFVVMIGAVSAFRGDWPALGRALALSATLVPFAAVARALAQRRPGARLPAIALCLAVTLGSGTAAVLPFVRPPENGHGVMYVVMGAVMWFVFGVVVLVQFVRTAGRKAFHPMPPGWISDPSREGRLRYWDGSRWTTHVAP